MDLNIFILFHKIEAFTKQAIFLISDLLMARQPCDKAASLFFIKGYEFVETHGRASNDIPTCVS